MTKWILYWTSTSKGKERERNSPKVDLGGVSKSLGGSNFVGDDFVVGVGKLVQQDQIIDLTNQTMQFDKEKEKEKEQDKGTSIVHFRASRYITGLNRTYE